MCLKAIMNKPLLVLVTAAVFGVSSFSGSAAAHTVRDAAGQPIKHKAHVKAKPRKADTGVSQATPGKAASSPASLPAVQTQSPAVSATGVAQTPVGSNVTPGTPAAPGK